MLEVAAGADNAALGAGEPFVDRTNLAETETEHTPWPTAEVATSFPDPPDVTDDESDAIALRIDTRQTRRRTSRPPGSRPITDRPRARLGADRWSVLFGEPADAPVATFGSEVPPAPKPPRIDVSPESRWEEEPAPPSALEQAVQNAMREKVFDRGGIWIDVVAELKERRSNSVRAPENDPSPVLRDMLVTPDAPAVAAPIAVETPAEAAPDADAPSVADATPIWSRPVSEAPSDRGRSTPPPVSASVAPRAREGYDAYSPDPAAWRGSRASSPDLRRSLPPSFAPASYRLRRRGHRWTYAKRLVTVRASQYPNTARFVVFSAIFALAAVLVSVDWSRRAPPTTQGAPSVAVVTQPQTTLVDREARAASTATSTAPSAAAVLDTAAPIATSAASPESDPVPADASDLPETTGYLEVVSTSGLPVYLNGMLAGDTQRWLHVGCGWRFLRLAQKGASPAGSSFPAWATEGRSVHVPCRGGVRVELEPD